MATILKDDDNQITLRSPDRIDYSHERRDSPLRRSDEFDALSSSEVILPIQESGDYTKATEFAIQMAKDYSARIVMVYITPRVEVPRGYREYAAVEKWSDYESSYYNSLGQEKISLLGRRIESAGVEWRSYVFIGKLNEALSSIGENRRATLVVLSPAKNGGLGSLLWFGKLTVAQISSVRVPVLIV